MESVAAAVAAVVQEFGRLDILVNNAGTFETAVLQSITVAQWDNMFETNTRGPFLMAQAAYPHLHKTKGRIINIGSLGGMHPWPTHGHYCTSKAALHMLTQTMAKAFAPEISVNCVAPGMIVNGEVDPAYEHFAEQDADAAQWHHQRRGRSGSVLRPRTALHHRTDPGRRRRIRAVVEKDSWDRWLRCFEPSVRLTLSQECR